MKIVGHESILSFFSRCIESNTISHAYAFLGPTHVGKRAVAEEIVRKLLGCSAEGPLVHPDLSILTRDVDEKTETLKKDISIAQIRDLTRRLSHSAFTKDGYVVAIIDGAEHLNLSAANALLKTLEEPHAKTVIFLISQDEGLLLPTIRSRVQPIYFSPVSETRICEYLISEGVDATHARELALDSHGLPGYACAWAKNSALYEEYAEEKSRFASLMHARFYEKLSVIEHFFENKDDHIEARSRISEVLTLWTFVLRDMMVNGQKKNEKNMAAFSTVIDCINESEEQLARNIHPRLILENIMLALP